MTKPRETAYLIVIITLIGLCDQLWYSYRYRPARAIRVYYNRDIQANEQVIATIQNADRFVYFAVYTFTRTDIADALLGAKHRGLDVQGIVDKGQLKSLTDQQKIVDELTAAGIPVETQNHSALMHIKTVVTDKGYASGSYNWTKAATDDNDEILEVGTDELLRRQYERDIKEVLDRYKQ
jgi:phosphatidylserine/phosphatidylglycerophosphate/cardiolipin synthase-like enzyme